MAVLQNANFFKFRKVKKSEMKINRSDLYRYQQPIYKQVFAKLDELIALIGLDGSESATEVFVYRLLEGASDADTAIERSHREGLCLDCRGHIADAILDSETFPHLVP